MSVALFVGVFVSSFIMFLGLFPRGAFKVSLHLVDCEGHVYEFPMHVVLAKVRNARTYHKIHWFCTNLCSNDQQIVYRYQMTNRILLSIKM